MKIIETIKALLAKANSLLAMPGDHQAEAMSFLNKAKELMEREQLTMEDLERDDPLGKHHIKEGKNGKGDWPEFLFDQTMRFYGCRVVRQHITNLHVKRHVYGRQSAVTTATLMFPYLRDTVRRLAAENHVAVGISADKAARRIGNALVIRMSALCAIEDNPTLNPTQNALVPIDRLNAMIAEHFPDMVLGRKSSLGVTKRAKDLANGINLGGQVGGTAGQRLLS